MALTSLLIPTKSELANTRYTPAELAANAEIETWFLDPTHPERLAFIRALWAAYIDGETSLTHDFLTYADAQDAATYLSGASTYNYTVTGPLVSPEITTVILVSWA